MKKTLTFGTLILSAVATALPVCAQQAAFKQIIANSRTQSSPEQTKPHSPRYKKVVIAEEGGDRYYVLKSDSTLWGWGVSMNFFYGISKDRNKSCIPVFLMDKVIDVSAAADHTMAIRSDSTLWAWGQNARCELGVDGGAAYEPIKVMEDVIQVKATGNHTLALKADSTLYSWGGDALNGALGDSQRTEDKNWLPFMIMEDVIFTDGSRYNGIAITKDGTLWGWGENSKGAVGQGYVDRQPIFTPTKIMSNVAKASVGHGYVLALRKDGTLWGWGNNFDDQVDFTSYTTIINKPRQIYPKLKFKDIFTFDANSFGITHTGDLYVWGNNYNKYIKEGKTLQKPVLLLHNVAHVAKGAVSLMYITTDGELGWWGSEFLKPTTTDF